jgi:hypothetical protein
MALSKRVFSNSLIPDVKIIVDTVLEMGKHRFCARFDPTVWPIDGHIKD